MRKRYVLKNKLRFAAFISTLLTLLIILISTNAYSNHSKFEAVRVMPGDTLWSIAEKINKDTDIRETIYNIKKLNNMEKSDIIAGTEIIVPVE